MPIQKQWLVDWNGGEIIHILKSAIEEKLCLCVPIQFKVYTTLNNPIHPQLQEKFDMSGAEVIYVSNLKPEGVDKRIIFDMTFKLYELQKSNETNAISLISGDRDFGYLLSKIHKQTPISHLFLIYLMKNKGNRNLYQIDSNLANNVDFVLQKFKFQNSKFSTPREASSTHNIFDYDAYMESKQSIFNYNFTTENSTSHENSVINSSNDSLITIYIQSNHSNEKNISLNVSVYNTIQNIIERILKEYNEYKTDETHESEVYLDGYKLYLKKILLENDKRLIDYNIKSETKLVMVQSNEYEKYQSSNQSFITDSTGPRVTPSADLSLEEFLANLPYISSNDNTPIAKFSMTQVNIYVINATNNKEFELKVNLMDTISDIKDEIEKGCGIIKHEQILFLYSNIKVKCVQLELNTNSLSKYDIHDNARIYVWKAGLISPFPIIVRKLDGTHFALTIERCIKIEDIKNGIKDKYNIDIEAQKLFLNKKMLEDNCNIDDYNINNMSVLCLVIKLIKCKGDVFNDENAVDDHACEISKNWRNKSNNYNKPINQCKENSYINVWKMKTDAIGFENYKSCGPLSVVTVDELKETEPVTIACHYSKKGNISWTKCKKKCKSYGDFEDDLPHTPSGSETESDPECK